MAPKATFPVTIPVRILLQIIVFVLSITALFAAGKGKLAIIFGCSVLIEMILMYSIEDKKYKVKTIIEVSCKILVDNS
ncbi:DUF2568 domain-containing protein [Psychrobacillus psychrotolerans]|uniref:DUF2568 domain-containing protein n=1 Tax=Psychrobacillus TaxID=1221880 RepID=UPI003988F40B